MLPVPLLLALLASFLSGLLFVPTIRSIAWKKEWLDVPDGKRKLHSKPTPNVGGMAIAASLLTGSVVLILFPDVIGTRSILSSIFVIIGAGICLGMGIFDDLHHLGFKKKFLLQIIVAYLLLHAGYRVEVTNLPYMTLDTDTQALFSIPLTLLWVVGVLNAINLLDGLDGLAAGTSLIAFLCFSAIFGALGDTFMAAVSLLTVGALAAFLIYNFNPASIFMGDSGSLILGYMLALCTLSLEDKAHSNAILGLLVPLVILGIPLYDTGLSFFRRFRRGGSPFAPDRNHIHHRLSRVFSKRIAVLILYGVAAWLGVVAILITRLNTQSSLAILMFTSIAIILGERLIADRDRSVNRGDGLSLEGEESHKIPELRVQESEKQIVSSESEYGDTTYDRV